MENNALINRLKTCLSGHSPLIYRHVIFQCGCHLKNSVVIQTCLQLHGWHKNNPLVLGCCVPGWYTSYLLRLLKCLLRTCFVLDPCLVLSEKWKSLRCVQLCVTPWTVTYQAPLFMGILQARILQWVGIPFSRWFSQSRDWTQVSCIAGGFFTIWATREATRVVGGIIKRNSMEW